MNSFLSNSIPSLLLLDTGMLFQLVGLLFITVFFFFLILFFKRYHFFGGELHRIKVKKWRIFSGVIIFFLVIVCSAFFMRQSQSSLKQKDDDGYVLVGGKGREVASEKEVLGQVLGEEDVVITEDAVPKSENYRLGFISIGGDKQLYLPDTEDKKLDLLSIGYKTVIDENRENTGAIIHWKTNKPSRGEILYRKSSDTEFRSIKEDSFGWEHTIVLEKLGYSSTYVFLISATDKWGNVMKSENYALYSGSNSPSLFDLLASAFGDIFGWAIKK